MYFSNIIKRGDEENCDENNKLKSKGKNKIYPIVLQQQKECEGKYVKINTYLYKNWLENFYMEWKSK